MASKKFERGTEEYEFYKDYYNYIQTYWIPEDNDAWWERCVNDGIKLSDKHGTRYSADMVHAFTLSRDRILRGEKG